MGLAPPPTRRQELADFLRQRRAVTSPEAVGLEANGHRRTPGLRREEVAQVAPALRAVVLELDPYPANLIGPRTDVLVWNTRPAARVLGEPSRAPDGRPNLLWWLFTGTDRQALGASARARSTLARFRAEHARHYDDPAFRELIEALLHTSRTFRELWRRHEVLDGQLGTKEVEHPHLGRLALNRLQTIPTSHPALRLTQLVPADAATRAALFGCR